MMLMLRFAFLQHKHFTSSCVHKFMFIIPLGWLTHTHATNVAIVPSFNWKKMLCSLFWQIICTYCIEWIDFHQLHVVKYWIWSAQQKKRKCKKWDHINPWEHQNGVCFSKWRIRSSFYPSSSNLHNPFRPISSILGPLFACEIGNWNIAFFPIVRLHMTWLNKWCWLCVFFFFVGAMLTHARVR